MFKRKVREPALSEKLAMLDSALAAGAKVPEALHKAGLTPRQYGLAMFQTHPLLRARFSRDPGKTEGGLG